jgi:tripartite-type tricarboxylate transporter receptor subunit TctC
VTTAVRAANLPDLPSVAEFLPGYEISGWNGIGAPVKTPGEIAGYLNTEINAGLVGDKLKAQLMESGVSVQPGSAADFAKLIADETAKWARVIKFAGIKPI